MPGNDDRYTTVIPRCLFLPLWTLKSPFPGGNGYFPVCYLKRPENALRTPYTPALTVCITSLSVSPVPAASPAAKYCLRSA